MRTLMLQRETTARLNAQSRLHTQRLSELESDIAVTERRLAVEKDVNSEMSGFLQRKNDSLGKDLNEWQEKLATDVEQARVELSRLKEDLADAVKDYDELNKKYIFGSATRADMCVQL